MVMSNVELRVADDSAPLTVEDWADLWTQLVRNGCVCTLATSSEQPAGEKSPELGIALILSAVTPRLVSVLVRFYEARRKCRITVRQGDNEWTVVGMTATEAEHSLSSIAHALSGTASQPGPDNEDPA